MGISLQTANGGSRLEEVAGTKSTLSKPLGRPAAKCKENLVSRSEGIRTDVGK